MLTARSRVKIFDIAIGDLCFCHFCLFGVWLSPPGAIVLLCCSVQHHMALTIGELLFRCLFPLVFWCLPLVACPWCFCARWWFLPGASLPSGGLHQMPLCSLVFSAQCDVTWRFAADITSSTPALPTVRFNDHQDHDKDRLATCF